MMGTSDTGVADTAETVSLEVFSVTDDLWYPVDSVDAMTEGSRCITVHFIDTQGQKCRKRVDTQGQKCRKRVLPGSEALHACEHDPELFFNSCCHGPSKPPPKSCATTPVEPGQLFRHRHCCERPQACGRPHAPQEPTIWKSALKFWDQCDEMSVKLRMALAPASGA